MNSPNRKPVKPRNTGKFLSLFDDIYITLNMGFYPDIDFWYRASRGQDRIDITRKELKRMGYRILAINNCIVRIVNKDYERFVICKKGNDSPGLVENIIVSESS